VWLVRRTLTEDVLVCDISAFSALRIGSTLTFGCDLPTVKTVDVVQVMVNEAGWRASVNSISVNHSHAIRK